MSISVVLLAYNEADNLKILLPKINTILGQMKIDYNIFVIDSKESSDNTEKMCIQNNANYIIQEEPYFAGAFKTGVKYADKDKILMLDADGSHNPESIPLMYNEFSEGYDVVIGSRYVTGGATHDYWYQIIMSKILNWVMRICIGVKAKDISTNFRIYDAKLVKSVIIEKKNYEIMQEVILKMKFKKKNLLIGEIPITFEKRSYGKSKRKLFKFILGYISSVFTFVMLRIKNIFASE